MASSVFFAPTAIISPRRAPSVASRAVASVFETGVDRIVTYGLAWTAFVGGRAGSHPVPRRVSALAPIVVAPARLGATRLASAESLVLIVGREGGYGSAEPGEGEGGEERDGKVELHDVEGGFGVFGCDEKRRTTLCLLL